MSNKVVMGIMNFVKLSCLCA